MLKKLDFVYPGDINLPTGGYIYDRRIIRELERLGIAVNLVSLPYPFPFVDKDDLDQTLALLTAQPPSQSMILDGLAFGAMGDIAASLAKDRHLVALVHHPLALETGLGREDQATFLESERRALSVANQVIVTSPKTRRTLISDYSPTDRDMGSIVSVVEPGMDRSEMTPGEYTKRAERSDPVRILSVGSLVPRKGYDDLVAALAELTSLNWTLTIVGDLTLHEQTTLALRKQIGCFGLTDRITLTGAIPQSDLLSCYDEHDVFALASHFEGYGMAYAEAVAAGLPVVGTTGGAIADTVPSACSILVPPGDRASLQAALDKVISDQPFRQRLSLEAHKANQDFQTWESAGKEFARIIEMSL